jgi:hypothetical protein
MYIVQGISSQRHGLHVTGQGEPNSQAQCHCRGSELSPNGLLLATDRARLADNPEHSG